MSFQYFHRFCQAKSLDGWQDLEVPCRWCLRNELIGQSSLFTRSLTWEVYLIIVTILPLTANLLKCSGTVVLFLSQTATCCTLLSHFGAKVISDGRFANDESMCGFSMPTKLLCLWILKWYKYILLRYWGFGFMLFDSSIFFSFF